MNRTPAWLLKALVAEDNPRAAASQFLFHGTITNIDQLTTADRPDEILWTSEDAAVAQSYCAASPITYPWTMPDPWTLDHKLQPDNRLNQILLWNLAGQFAERCTPLLYDPPTIRQSIQFLRDLGYPVEDRYCEVKVRIDEKVDTIMPANAKVTGQLFIIERPRNLKIRSLLDSIDELQPTTHNPTLYSFAKEDGFDAIEVRDSQISPYLGRFTHTSIALFQHALDPLRYHRIPACHVDPWTCWKSGGATPEFDALWESCRDVAIAA